MIRIPIIPLDVIVVGTHEEIAEKIMKKNILSSIVLNI